MNLKGWNSQAHREYPGKSESSNLGREILSREIGRSPEERRRERKEEEKEKEEAPGGFLLNLRNLSKLIYVY